MTKDSSQICFICLDDSEEDGNPLISPCACRGSAAFVHISCLKCWHSTSDSCMPLSCPTCKQQYIGEIAEVLARSHVSRVRAKSLSEYPDPHMKILEECWAMDQLGQVSFSQGKYDESLAIFTESLKNKKAVIGEDRVNVANSYEDIGSVYRMRGQYENALNFKMKALEIRKKHLGHEHFDTMTSYNNIGLVLQNMGKTRESLPYFKTAITSYEQKSPQGSTSMACTLNNLAGSHRFLGNFDQAEQLYRRSLAMRTRILGNEHPAVAESLNNLSLVMMDIGKMKEAEELSSQCMTLVNKLYDQHQPVYLNYLGNFGMVLAAIGKNPVESKSKIRRALAGLRANNFPDSHVWNQKFIAELGEESHLVLSPASALAEDDHPQAGCSGCSPTARLPKILSKSNVLGLIQNKFKRGGSFHQGMLTRG